ncbi:MAG: hypothetical protein GXP58_06070 [Deltaproteobacteria bacterium]|nr:hypothetical protein [Deltaproteobacteria bacterium]
MSWERVDELIKQIRSIGPWYIFSPAEGVDSLFEAGGEEASRFLVARTEELKARPYGPGWVYVHSPDAPSWIKIYDPCKCGSSCSITTPPAWWEMDLIDPADRIAPENSSMEEKKFLLHFFKGK